MKDAGQVLALLRTNPATACAAWGFMCRGAVLNSAVGAGCTLTCAVNDAVYQIDVAAGAGDWFIPFAQGAARYCDVPRGERDGTLVVTFPMNGCALEVHAIATGNRFFHDSDGKHMPSTTTSPKFRVDADIYEGAGAPAAAMFAQETTKTVGQNFEHTLVCVKSGARWDVYQTAVVTKMSKIDGSRTTWHVKNGPPVMLGSFAD